jgi:Zn-dependent M28 family amino/carboxypeptidase
VTVQEFDHLFLQQKVKLYNIIAVLKSDPKAKAGKLKGILLCTHWDSRPWADQDIDIQKQKLPIIGANDGLSGTALQWALAQDLSKSQNRRPIALAFFDGEDLENPALGTRGLVGSRYFAKNHSLKDYEFGILLDMVGDKNLTIYREQLSEQLAKKINDRVFFLAQKIGITGFHNSVKHSIIDDHVPLNQAGLPTIDLIDFDYPYWHTSEDTLDKLSGENLLSVGNLLRRLVSEN